MENASEALMMAFGILIFVLALTVAINSFNSVKTTSDVVLYSADESNYYDYQGATGKASQNREVGLETIIPTLYKYYKENYTVLFRDARNGGYNTETGNFTNVSPLTLYKTPSTYQTSNGTYLWGKAERVNGLTQSTYDTLMQNKYSDYFTTGYTKTGNHNIFSFDLEEETLRNEPWTGTYEKSKQNLDCFLNGEPYYNPNNPTGKAYIKYNDSLLRGFIGQYNNKKFIETIGEYSYSNESTSGTEDNYELQLNTNKKKKRIVIFTLVD